jgi:hypothetical protein
MKLYANKVWLRQQYVVKKRDIDEIAAEAGCTIQTIYVYLKKFDLV